MHIRTLPLLAAAMLCAAATTPAHAQAAARRAAAPRAYLDYFALDASRSLAGGADGGFGGRLMFRLPGDAALPAHVALGAYAANLPDHGEHTSTWEYGVQSDLHVAPAGFVDPLLTLGFGAVRREQGWSWRYQGRPVRVPAHASLTTLALSPGVGARLHLGRGLALRGDLRHAFKLQRDGVDGTTVDAGISLPL